MTLLHHRKFRHHRKFIRRGRLTIIGDRMIGIFVEKAAGSVLRFGGIFLLGGIPSSECLFCADTRQQPMQRRCALSSYCGRRAGVHFPVLAQILRGRRDGERFLFAFSTKTRYLCSIVCNNMCQ